MIGAARALDRLKEGNGRFVAGVRSVDALASAARRDELLSKQEPFAVVLGCSDSRVPVEIVFDQGLGDLFVIRVAGNIVAPSHVDSVEFAAERFGTRLVVVLGHTCCGAVTATVDDLLAGPSTGPRQFASIIDRIRPSVEGLVTPARAQDRTALVHAAVRANVRAAASQLRHGSTMLERLVREDGLLVAGAVYALETGVVEFLEPRIGQGEP